MFKTVIDSNGPFYVRLPRGSFPIIHDDNYEFNIGQPDILKDGNDICLIGTGYGSILAYISAPQLEEELDCSIKVINLSTIKPIDENQLIKEVKNMKGIITFEEHNLYCGFGSILARIIAEKNPIQMKFVGVNNSFGQSGKRKQLLSAYGLNYDSLKEQVQDLLQSISI
jgi:transketolase